MTCIFTQVWGDYPELCKKQSCNFVTTVSVAPSSDNDRGSPDYRRNVPYSAGFPYSSCVGLHGMPHPELIQ